ncbi:hypothetical protein HY492_01400 [Candidatus Woesearchaeota archaeon]|nr:hypothetical protein [Candidatus Woesearchaeota archaeon]
MDTMPPIDDHHQVKIALETITAASFEERQKQMQVVLCGIAPMLSAGPRNEVSLITGINVLDQESCCFSLKVGNEVVYVTPRTDLHADCYLPCIGGKHHQLVFAKSAYYLQPTRNGVPKMWWREKSPDGKDDFFYQECKRTVVPRQSV